MKKTLRFIYHIGELIMVAASLVYLVQLIMNLKYPLVDLSGLKPFLMAAYGIALLLLLVGFIGTYDEYKAKKAQEKAEKAAAKAAKSANG